MPRLSGLDPLAVERLLLVAAEPSRIIAAFFDPAELARWWQVIRSVTTPRPLGVYAVEWPATEYRDDILGPLGGIFHGTVMDFKAGREFFVANAYWLPPVGEPLGPMALEVSCTYDEDPRGARQPTTLVRVRQTGSREGPRWTRYCEVVERGWELALESLREHIEKEHPR